MFRVSILVCLFIFNLDFAIANVDFSEGNSSVCQLVNKTGHSEGVLVIRGYISEKFEPEVIYNEGHLIIENGSKIGLGANQKELHNIESYFKNLGIRPKIISGGTTYYEYSGYINCGHNNELQTKADDGPKKCRTICRNFPCCYVPRGQRYCYEVCD